MSNKCVKSIVLFKNFLDFLDLTQNSFFRFKLSYFSLANIQLHRYDSSLRSILLLSEDININPVSNSVNGNQNGIIISIVWVSYNYFKTHENSKREIFKKMKSN